jgi:hypothetical protein
LGAKKKDEDQKAADAARFGRDLDLVRALRDKAVETKDPNLATLAASIRLDARVLRWTAWGDKVREKEANKEDWEVSPQEVSLMILHALGDYDGLLLKEDAHAPELGSYEVYWNLGAGVRVYVREFDPMSMAETGTADERAEEILQAYEMSYEMAEKIQGKMQTGD